MKYSSFLASWVKLLFYLQRKKERNKMWWWWKYTCTGTFFQRTSENCCHLNLSLIHVSIISLNMREKRERERERSMYWKKKKLWNTQLTDLCAPLPSVPFRRRNGKLQQQIVSEYFTLFFFNTEVWSTAAVWSEWVVDMFIIPSEEDRCIKCMTTQLFLLRVLLDFSFLLSFQKRSCFPFIHSAH